MPWTLYRHVLSELLRTITLTAGVLVTVIAFGATIKPLAAGLLEPEDIARYVGLAIVPMLQFALPFAAGFGSTIVLHRMTGDNEVVACAACGMSYRRFLCPVIGLGATLTITLLLLVHLVIPNFWVMMQRIATQDATRMFENAVSNHEAFVVGNVQIFADEVYPDYDPQPLAGAADALRPKLRLRLRRVAAAEMDDEGRIKTDITARAAVADFYDFNGRTVMNLAMQDTYVYQSEMNSLAWAPVFTPGGLLALPDNFKDNPKLMSLPRLLEVRRDPDSYAKIMDRNFELASALQEYECWEAIQASVESERHLTLISSREGEPDVRYEIIAERCRAGFLTRAGTGRVSVTEYLGEVAQRVIECERMELSIVRSDVSGVLLDAVMVGCNVTAMRGPAAGSESFATALTAGQVALPAFSAAELYALGHRELLRRGEMVERNPRVSRAIESVRDELEDMNYETKARIWSRTSLATTGILLMLLGSVLAMKMRNSLPLTIYLLAFLPSILDLLLISGGEQMMRDNQDTAGLIVVWSGNGVLLVLNLLTYARLARN